VRQGKTRDLCLSPAPSNIKKGHLWVALFIFQSRLEFMLFF